MAYQPMIFKDRTVERPDGYEMTTDGGGKQAVRLKRDPGAVYEEGTPINALAMNYLANGVYEAKTTRISPGRRPDTEDNAAQGMHAGDRWLIGKTEVTNLVPDNWNKLQSWPEDKTTGPAPYTWKDGVNEQGIRQIGLNLQNTVSTASGTYLLSGLPMPDLKKGHRYYVSFTFRHEGNTSVVYSPVFGLKGKGNPSFYIASALATVRPNDNAVKVGCICSTMNMDATNIIAELSVFGNAQTGTWTANFAFEGLTVIDLTEAFGAGNEPEIALMKHWTSWPLTCNLTADRERYFASACVGRPRAFACAGSGPQYASWEEQPSLSFPFTYDPSTAEVMYKTGFSFGEAGLPRYYRFGPFVYFEISLTATVAMTAGTVKAALTGLPIPNHALKVPLRGLGATSNLFLLFDPKEDATSWYVQAITAAAVNDVYRASGLYLARDMGDA